MEFTRLTDEEMQQWEALADNEFEGYEDATPDDEARSILAEICEATAIYDDVDFLIHLNGRCGAEIQKWMGNPAFECYASAAFIDGNPEAYWKLGDLYAGGRGVRKSVRMAWLMYSKAYERGHGTVYAGRAAHHLADCLLNGVEGVSSPTPSAPSRSTSRPRSATTSRSRSASATTRAASMRPRPVRRRPAPPSSSFAPPRSGTTPSRHQPLGDPLDLGLRLAEGEPLPHGCIEKGTHTIRWGACRPFINAPPAGHLIHMYMAVAIIGLVPVAPPVDEVVLSPEGDFHVAEHMQAVEKAVDVSVDHFQLPSNSLPSRLRMALVALLASP